MTATATVHETDADCTVDKATGCCADCGVEHIEPCGHCGATAFHPIGCPANEVTAHTTFTAISDLTLCGLSFANDAVIDRHDYNCTACIAAAERISAQD
jgi:hypothetical protein